MFWSSSLYGFEKLSEKRNLLALLIVQVVNKNSTDCSIQKDLCRVSVAHSSANVPQFDEFRSLLRAACNCTFVVYYKNRLKWLTGSIFMPCHYNRNANRSRPVGGGSESGFHGKFWQENAKELTFQQPRCKKPSFRLPYRLGRRFLWSSSSENGVFIENHEKRNQTIVL